MKNLKKFIRKILLENELHVAKLIEMIASADHESIIQALHLANQIGLIAITHEQEHERNWRGSYNCKFTIRSETFGDKLKEIAPVISKGYHLTYGSNILLRVQLLQGEVGIRRNDHYVFSEN